MSGFQAIFFEKLYHTLHTKVYPQKRTPSGYPLKSFEKIRTSVLQIVILVYAVRFFPPPHRYKPAGKLARRAVASKRALFPDALLRYIRVRCAIAPTAASAESPLG